MEEAVVNRTVHPVPALPPMSQSSPRLVLAMDLIRRELGGHDEYGEFYWFAREYPRCYRHHLDCAEHRLHTIHDLYEQIHVDLAPGVLAHSSMFGTHVSDIRSKRVYWDFESYIGEINNSLDLLARIAGLAYRNQTPPNFNRFCKLPSSPLVSICVAAQTRWVTRLKSYRDCFTHFTPVDTILSVGLDQYSDGFHMRAKLPTNPSVRDILGFRYNRRVELLAYANTVWRQMSALDRAVAQQILFLYREGAYPVRTTRLFFVG